MQRDLCAYLEDVITAHDRILLFLTGFAFEQFEASDLVVNAVERNLEIIGEALAQASQLFPGSLDTVSELKYVKAQRNRIAHGYFNVDAARLWKAIHEDLPLLRGKIVEIQKLRCS